MDKLTLDDLPPDELRGKVVLTRVDYNVPLDEAGNVVDDTRIRSTLPTLGFLLGAGARVVLLAHFGRPKGKPDPSMSLAPVAKHLDDLLDASVEFVADTSGDEAAAAIDALAEGSVLLLENTRFDAEEEANGERLAERLASFGDVYVNDAFGAAHRAHASTSGVADVIRNRGGKAVAGRLMQRELEYLGSALDDPGRTFVAILGGAKISGKIDVIEALLPKTDRLLIGGAMANTFFRAQGYPTGDSLVEGDRVAMASDLLSRSGERLVLPTDVVIAREIAEGAETRAVSVDAIPDGWKALDIGPDTARRFAEEIASAKTVLWNGPMGVAEISEFRTGTESVARALVAATRAGATTIVGGGDSAAALVEMGLDDQVSHLSTGGGASLEFLEGKPLPGVASLSDRATP